jgi:hypothetical protein
VWVNNRLYIAGNTTYPYRLYFSNINDPTTFGGSDYIDIKPESNDEITGLGILAGMLIIGKRNRVLTFDGFTVDDFTVKSLGEELPNYGITSHRSIVNTGDDLLFMSFAGNIPHIRSLKRTSFDKLNYGGVISDIIEGTMSNINKDRLDVVAAGFDGRYAWWAVPTGTSIVNDYVICKDTFMRDPEDGWTVHTAINASVWFRSILSGNDRLYFGSNTSTSKIYELNSNVLSKDSNTIDWQVITRMYKPQLNRKSKFKYVYWTLSSDSTASITVSASRDGYTYQEMDTLSSEASTSVFPITFPFRFGETVETRPPRTNLAFDPSYSFQMKLTEASSTSGGSFPLTFPITFGDNRAVEIKDFEIFYFPRGLR